MHRISFVVGLVCILVCLSCKDEEAAKAALQLVSASAGSKELDLTANLTENIPLGASISLTFSLPLNETSAVSNVLLQTNGQTVDTEITVLSDRRTLVLRPIDDLLPNTVYNISVLGGLQGAGGEVFVSRSINFKTSPAALTIMSAEIAGNAIASAESVTNVPLNLSLKLTFSAPVNTTSLQQAVSLTGDEVSMLTFSFSEDARSVEITAASPLNHLSRYQFRILSILTGMGGEKFSGFSKTFYTKVDPTPKFPIVSDEQLLTIVQEHTFKYFWDFAHPVSGMARERNTSGDVVTTGGTGFGIMALIVGMERSFISRAQGLERMNKILMFLESADRFHGAWPHWLNGATGDVVPFSPNDNGGDLVETSFLVQGMLTFRQYLDGSVPEESVLIERINALWQTVEWDWYTQGGQNVLYWHWSPDKQWIMNHAIRGYNEALITYFLAVASPQHAITEAVYHQGWAGNGAIENNKAFYGIVLPLGSDFGGPLFFAHYSFLGLDPRNLQDSYANYWTQNVNHSLINYAYSVDNPQGFVGYSDENWGLTASDNHQGYSAHSPTNDLGVITPSAALSSFPYTPTESMRALKFFYYTLGDKLWGPYGFYDAFNVTAGWTADSYLAIDQGPIIVMIENHRTGLLWDLFMSSPEVQVAMEKLGFTR